MKLDVIRAWKDEIYRQSLSAEQLRLLPVNPVGDLDLTDVDLDAVCGDGGGPADGLGTWGGGEIVNGSTYSFALSCKNVQFSVTVITGTRVFNPVTIICIKDDA